MSVTVPDARARLVALIEQVNDDQAAVEITSEKGTAYLVSEDEYLSLRETVHLLRSPRNAERLRESLAEAQTGGGRPRHHR
ncbi:type II toxin-antitoxin system Phd/YefM family antitoxin [Kineococcus sp. TBRC 1896]|uniref:Antitoxin n=1 Tax=Kineococcus mangrovi TaxID=1660183 RepID=A0ABV4I579_9ACTN